MGLEGLGLGINLDDNTTILNPGRISDISWNGRNFVCRATTTNGRIVQKNIALCVRGHNC